MARTFWLAGLTGHSSHRPLLHTGVHRRSARLHECAPGRPCVLVEGEAERRARRPRLQPPPQLGGHPREEARLREERCGQQAQQADPAVLRSGAGTKSKSNPVSNPDPNHNANPDRPPTDWGRRWASSSTTASSVSTSACGGQLCADPPPRGVGQCAPQHAPPAPDRARGGLQPRPASANRQVHSLAGHTGFFFHIGGSRSARARPARSRSRTTARSHCGLRRVGRRPKAKARGDGNGKEFNCEPCGVQRPAAHSSAVARRVGRSRRSNLKINNNTAQRSKSIYISRILYVTLACAVFSAIRCRLPRSLLSSFYSAFSAKFVLPRALSIFFLTSSGFIFKTASNSDLSLS